eukprot:3941674-Rhodomonas_salina.2
MEGIHEVLVVGGVLSMLDAMAGFLVGAQGSDGWSTWGHRCRGALDAWYHGRGGDGRSERSRTELTRCSSALGCYQRSGLHARSQWARGRVTIRIGVAHIDTCVPSTLATVAGVAGLRGGERWIRCDHPVLVDVGVLSMLGITGGVVAGARGGGGWSPVHG